MHTNSHTSSYSDTVELVKQNAALHDRLYSLFAEYHHPK